MSILEKISSLYAPLLCLGCGEEEDKLMCQSCINQIARVPSRCYLCRATTRNYHVCNRCKAKTPLQSVTVWGHHEGIVKDVVHTSKYERAVAGIVEMADCMMDLLPYVTSGTTVIVPVPTASSRMRERGYDQAVVIARHIARKSVLPFSNSLVRLNQAHQVGATRAERRRHAHGCFRIRRVDAIAGKNVLLVDDVCTTGATLEEAARTLKAAGARKVNALVFSQPN